MAINYTLSAGNQVPGKPKKLKRTGPAPTSQKEGEISKEKRMVRFSKPSEQGKMKELMKVNTQSQKAINEGLELNEYGAPKGGQKHKIFRKLNKKVVPKFQN